LSVAGRPRAGASLRAAYALVYGAAAVFGAALLAPTAVDYVRGLGLVRPVLEVPRPGGAPALVLLVLLGALTMRFALALVQGTRPRLREHAVFLLLIAFAIAVLAASGPGRPAPDPAPALEAGLRATARALEAAWAGARYEPDPAALAAALANLPAPGFVLRGRRLPLLVRLVSRARQGEGPDGAVVEALPNDTPGTIYVALSADGTRAWLSALTLGPSGIEPLRVGARPLVMQARGGTHGAIGGDPLLPAYPARRPYARARVATSP
jgi:hypothetical protein